MSMALLRKVKFRCRQPRFRDRNLTEVLFLAAAQARVRYQLRFASVPAGHKEGYHHKEGPLVV